MAPRLLLIEDNRHKRQKICSLISEWNLSTDIMEARSYTSGWQALQDKEFDLVILDMSLPTYDTNENETGGKFRTFGGKEIVRRIARRNIKTKFVFITQYSSFNDTSVTQSLGSIEEELISDYGDQCLGVIRFDTATTEWKETLIGILSKELC